MLFDLRGRGRRTTVRIVYIGLAVLIGIGLVGFGIGGGFGSGGILNAASNNEGSNGATYANEIKKYERLTRQQPSDAAAWEGLVKGLLHEASNFTQNGITPKGHELLERAANAWGGYLALKPAKPNAELALLMVNYVYNEEALNQPSQAVQALQIALTTRPSSAGLYGQLAEFAYKAKNVRLGDLSAAKAVSLAPASERVRVREQLAQVKANPSGEKTYTTTTNGKTYAVKKAPNGTFTGTVVQTTPAPATTTKK